MQVVCRLRPMNKIEQAKEGKECVEYTDSGLRIRVEEQPYDFALDRVFGPSSKQIDIYEEVGLPIISGVIAGFNGTIFAYGQTGGGKTWTMEGPSHHDHEHRGLIPRTIEGLFGAIGECLSVEFVVKCSYVQIYNEKIFDLLDPSKARLEIKEDRVRGVFIQNCTEVSVGSVEHMLQTMDAGAQNRKVAFTGMNQRSSRSHSIFIVYISQRNIKKDSTKASKLYFVDLAGSEKVGKTGVVGQQLEQAKSINKSLSSLGNVINALTAEKKEHIPYRDSKLTRMLQESLGGNSKTTLIVNCSMCDYNDKETLSTLRFGARAKTIKNRAKVNEQRSPKELILLLDAANKTIQQLQHQLANGQIPIPLDPCDKIDEEDKEEKEAEIGELESRVKFLVLQLAEANENHCNHMQTCIQVTRCLKQRLEEVTKYMLRVKNDLEYWSCSLLEGTPQLEQSILTTGEHISRFITYYRTELHSLLSKEEENTHPDNEEREETVQRMSRNGPAQSQPNLRRVKSNESLFRIEDRTVLEESSHESHSQIDTLLESLQTKESYESYRQMMQEMKATVKAVRRENQELSARNAQLRAEGKVAEDRLEATYAEKYVDLEERADEYRHIIKLKDSEIFMHLEHIRKDKIQLTTFQTQIELLRKVVQSNNLMKEVYSSEQKVRNLVRERQKMFNQIYQIRANYDQMEVNCREKDQVIASLKKVIKEVNSWSKNQDKDTLNKRYNSKMGVPESNIVLTVQGGTEVKKKKSDEKPNIGSYKSPSKRMIPFLKGLFGK